MQKVTLKHVNRVRARGRVYYYHRKTGARLPDDAPARAAKVLEINAALTTDKPVKFTAMPGTLADIVQRFKASPAYSRLGQSTRRDYLRYLDHLLQRFGHLDVADIDRPFVLELRDHFAATPRKADYLVSVLRKLLNFAVDRGVITHNPAMRPGRLALNVPHSEWPDAALTRFRTGAPTRLVWAVELALYTGQRLGDVLAMQWSHHRDGKIFVTQRKTGARLAIPVHRDLVKVLEAMERARQKEKEKKNAVLSTMLLINSHGLAWTSDGFSASFRKQLARLGLDGLTFHGLRHTAGMKLAEAGCTDREIMAILGHRTAIMVTRYTRQADQQRLGEAAIFKLERRNDE